MPVTRSVLGCFFVSRNYFLVYQSDASSLATILLRLTKWDSEASICNYIYLDLNFVRVHLDLSYEQCV
jgi:hypothetical protein